VGNGRIEKASASGGIVRESSPQKAAEGLDAAANEKFPTNPKNQPPDKKEP